MFVRTVEQVSILFYGTAALTAGIALLAFFRDSGAPARRTFCAALGLLAIQSVLAGLIHNAEPRAALQWRAWWLIPQALTPAVWLLFVLKYSRGNFSVSIRKWIPILLSLSVVPVAAITLFADNVLVLPEGAADSEEFVIGLSGFALYLAVVLGSALIHINVERTFRAAVGTMRWRIK